MASAIYAIRNALNGKRYVGSAVLLSRRKAQHFSMLRMGEHTSIKLQRAWDKDGADAFQFQILELVEDPVRLIEREQYWMDVYNAYGDDGYNVQKVAGATIGYQHTEEAKAKMRGRVFSDAHRAKISANSAARRASPETKAKLSAIQRGKVVSEETKARMRASSVGRKMPPRTSEHLAKHAAAMRANALAKRIAQQESKE